MKSEQVKALLNEKYSGDDSCLIAFEVNEGTGGTGGRIADAIAFHLWPSKDYKMIGFEIKVSRSDWLNEMKQPDKSMALSQFCDEWYLVAPKGVLGIDELPKTWGYMEANDKRLTTKIRAPKREAVAPDKPFMASLLRSMVKKHQGKSMLQELLNRATERAEKRYLEMYEGRLKRAKEETEEYRKLIEKFHQQTGLYLREYNLGNIVDAVRALKDESTREQKIKQVKDRIANLNALIEGDTKAIQQLESLSSTIS